jgi:hypothetical protein
LVSLKDEAFAAEARKKAEALRNGLTLSSADARLP